MAFVVTRYCAGHWKPEVKDTDSALEVDSNSKDRQLKDIGDTLWSVGWQGSTQENEKALRRRKEKVGILLQEDEALIGSCPVGSYQMKRGICPR